MSHYQHLSISEREKILILHTAKKSIRSISTEIGRSASTISREIKRNSGQQSDYSAIEAQRQYQKRRRRCRRRKLLANAELQAIVMRLFLEQQWSPEQIAGRLSLKNSDWHISYNTIYRAIYTGMFDTPAQKRSEGNRGAIRKLRHRGKT